jgi:hypothetical protein
MQNIAQAIRRPSPAMAATAFCDGSLLNNVTDQNSCFPWSSKHFTCPLAAAETMTK